MTEENLSATDISVLGRPNSYIGRSVPRPNARRLLSGQGQFVDDLKLPRMPVSYTHLTLPTNREV